MATTPAFFYLSIQFYYTIVDIGPDPENKCSAVANFWYPRIDIWSSSLFSE